MLRQTILDAVRAVLAADEGVIVAYVFGSVGRGDAASGSDVDVALLGNADLNLEHLSRLSEDLGRALDFQAAVDVVDLRTAPPLLAFEIVRDGEVVLERDPLARFDFEMAAVRRYEDTRPLRRVQQDLLREAARGPA